MQTFSLPPLLYYIKDLRFLPPLPPFPPSRGSQLFRGGGQAPGIFFLPLPATVLTNIYYTCCYNVSQMALGQVETLYLFSQLCSIDLVNNCCQYLGVIMPVFVVICNIGGGWMPDGGLWVHNLVILSRWGCIRGHKPVREEEVVVEEEGLVETFC